MPMPMPKTAGPQSDAQKAFEKLKTLAGSWQGSFLEVQSPRVDKVLANDVSFDELPSCARFRKRTGRDWVIRGSDRQFI